MEPPPSPLVTGAVCCMCGDHGLPHDLVRCKLCRVRLQHRYDSDLYPRATAYRRCNWCPREPAEAHAHAHAVTNKSTEKRKAATSTGTSASEEEEERRHHGAGCTTATRSRRSATEVSKPVKKPKVDERPALLTPPSAAAKGNNSDKKPMQAGKLARAGRVKVRRYKLLAELISC